MYFLLINFDQIISQFSLVFVSHTGEIKIISTVKVLSSFFASYRADYFFEKAIEKLEQLSDRKLIKKHLLLIMDSEKVGVSKVFFTGNKNLENRIENLKIFKLITTEDLLKKLLELLTAFDIRSSIYQIDNLGISYGDNLNRDSVKMLRKEYNEIINKIIKNNFHIEEFLKWMPFDVDMNELINYLSNKSLYPQVIASSFREILINQILTQLTIKELQSELSKKSENFNKIIISQYDKNPFSSDDQFLLSLIKGLEFNNITYFYLSGVESLLSFVPILVNYKKDAGFQKKLLLQLLAHNYTVIHIDGIKENQKMGKVTINQGYQQEQEVELEGNNFYSVPNKGEMLITLRAEAGVKEILTKNPFFNNNDKIEIIGGNKGLIWDTRSYPVELFDIAETKKILNKWNQSLNIFENIKEL